MGRPKKKGEEKKEATKQIRESDLLHKIEFFLSV